MNFENILKYIKSPAKLLEISYQDLKELVDIYPYSQNLWQLLLYKSKIEGRNDTELLLQRVSTYSIDRDFLFTKLHDEKFLKEEEVEAVHDVLELMDLEEIIQTVGHVAEEEETDIIARKAEAIPLPVSDNEPESKVADYIEPETQHEEKDLLEKLVESIPDDEFDNEQITEEGRELFSKEEFTGFVEWIKESSAENSKEPEEEITLEEVVDWQKEEKKEKKKHAKKKTKKIQRKSFQRWQLERHENEDQSLDGLITKMVGKKKKEEKTKKKDLAKVLAKKSVSVNKEIVSEVLAKIHVNQGNYKEAIEMYGKLVLLFPEKKAHFESEIENIKKKIVE